jgi:hypothetical protein
LATLHASKLASRGLAVTFALACTACHKSPTQPANHSPVMVSLSVMPAAIAPSDSAAITCIATDQDGDTLVYDWETDLRLRIKGASPNVPVKYNTFNNTEIFYPNYAPADSDTVWVVVTVRDRRGGAAVRPITCIIHP